jgi:AraC-like DNA-binding protein
MIKRCFLIAAVIFFAAAPRARGQAADTAVSAPGNAHVDTSANISASTPVTTQHADTSSGVHANAGADTSSDTPVGAPADTPASAPVNTFAGTPVNAPANTPDTPDTPINASVSTPVNTPADTPSAATQRNDTSLSGSSADTSADDTPAEKKAQKIFLLPSYAIHIFFLAVFVAMIAATLYYFFARRDRGDAQRFLTTTRLSVLDKLVQRACRHVESNYPDPALTPEAVCNSLVTGKAYLDALFMNELGINVQDFIVQVRVNAIKNRLSADHAARQTPDIGEICAECGFADRAEAERCFATVCGGVGIAEFARFSKMQSQRR